MGANDLLGALTILCISAVFLTIALVATRW